MDVCTQQIVAFLAEAPAWTSAPLFNGSFLAAIFARAAFPAPPRHEKCIFRGRDAVRRVIRTFYFPPGEVRRDERYQSPFLISVLRVKKCVSSGKVALKSCIARVPRSWNFATTNTFTAKLRSFGETGKTPAPSASAERTFPSSVSRRV